jgi:hypothetical protein
VKKLICLYFHDFTVPFRNYLFPLSLLLLPRIITIIIIIIIIVIVLLYKRPKYFTVLEPQKSISATITKYVRVLP